MAHWHGISDQEDDAAEAESIARARADIAAGRVYPHAVVAEWIETWDKPGRATFKEWLASRHG
ncbi:antitoxin [Sphingomonas sp. BK580]|uniref:antitoxin n=1 Tax=Sphingomonas sp. BK580 TaxID=2586972 RepID=UPI001620FFB8|nr:antitoxin [Sphingomonas sp. BK580]MBB3691546.1 putative transcriptional regulator [Sphingomonas sp. BK580]